MLKNNIFKKTKPFLVKLHIFNILSFFYHTLRRTHTYFLNIKNKLITKTIPILLYHRIDNISYDPVMLTVNPTTFENHIGYINKKYKPISLSELIVRLKNKTLKGDEICITFDDGYKDNLTNALPILEKYKTPATIFITTSNLGKKGSFPWDLKYIENDRAYFLSEEEIKELSKNSLIEIGAHTNNHVRLSDLSKEKQTLEIKDSIIKLEKIISKKIKHFAYPFGSKNDFNEESKKITKELELMSAYENTDLFVTTSSDLYSLPRINIREGDIKYLEKKLYI